MFLRANNEYWMEEGRKPSFFFAVKFPNVINGIKAFLISELSLWLPWNECDITTCSHHLHLYGWKTVFMVMVNSESTVHWEKCLSRSEFRRRMREQIVWQRCGNFQTQKYVSLWAFFDRWSNHRVMLSIFANYSFCEQICAIAEQVVTFTAAISKLINFCVRDLLLFNRIN
jgi:hypothetical protein